MIIKQTNLNLVYPKLTDYRKKFTNSEHLLQNHFMPATLLPIPDQVQDDVPRIIVQTQNGHSVLNIALTVSSFITNYTDEFINDWDKCNDYLGKRCSEIYTIINELTGNNNIFVGLVTEIEIDNLSDDGLNVLKNSLCSNKADKMGDLHDLSFKFTYVLQDKYYINITLQNLREFEVEKRDGGRTFIIGEKKHTISAIIDVNDRYAANNERDYTSTKKAFDDILDITSNIINNKLEEFIINGEFKYD